MAIDMIDAEQVVETLDMGTCIELMRDAFIALAEGGARQLLRPVLPLYGRNVLGMMPAYHAGRDVAGVKVLTVFPKNYEKNVPSHQGHVILFETKTGRVKAVVDAESITALRTAAASAVMTDALARPDASRLAVLGAGLQGRQHLEAIRFVRELDEVTVWDLRPEAAVAYAAEMSEKTGLPVTPCATVQEAVQGADIICTVTPAEEPILFAEDVSPGVHINAIGACAPDVRELSGDLMAAGRLFVDWLPAARVEAGDVVIAVDEGAIDEEHILGEAGDVLRGVVPGRIAPEDITIFEGLGQAVQDVVAANYVAEARRGREDADLP